MRIIRVCAVGGVLLLAVLAAVNARQQSELSIEGIPSKITYEHYGFGTRFVYLRLSKEFYSKENLERIWRYYCEKYADKKDKLDIRVFVERPGLDSKAVEALSFDADFNRQGEGAAASGGDNEFYTYRPDLEKPDSKENVQLKGRYPFLRGSYSDDPGFDFVLAGYKGDLARLEQYLASGGDVNVRNDKGRTALMSTCEAGRIEIAQMLLAKGANPNLEDEDGDTALRSATMIAGSDPNTKAGYWSGNIGIVKLLLEKGADVKIESGKGWPALVLAAEYGENDIVKLLLEKGADVNARNERGMSALSRAIYNGKDETVEILLAHGANVESRDESGDTPLIFAASRNTKILRSLLDRGANANVRNNNLETALIHAFSGESVVVLLDHKAELDAKDKSGMTALMHAALWRNPEKLRVILEKGADVNARTPEGETALSIAKQNSNYRSMVELLLKFGATQ